MSFRVNQTTALPPAVLSIACVLLASLAMPARSAETPQLVLIHGRIITADSSDAIVQALAVRDGKIVAVGPDREILGLAGAATRRIDLHGRTATPGLIDTHAHIADA